MTPSRAEAGGGWALFFKEMILDVGGWFFGDRILQSISNEAMSWAQTGFGSKITSVGEGLNIETEFGVGEEAFLVDPNAFFSTVQSNVSRHFLTELSNEIGGALPERFGDQIVEELTRQQQRDLAPRDDFAGLESTISDDELDAFMGNFTEGGWETFLELTENPNNYFDGAFLAAQEELDNWQAEMEQQYRQELQQGEGFLSLRECETGGSGQPDAMGCTGYTNVTPGSVVSDRTGRATSTDISRIQSADEVSEVIASMVQMVFSNLTRDGLSAFNISQAEQDAGRSAHDAFEDSLGDIADNVRDQNDTEDGAYDTGECAFKADGNEEDIEECFDDRDSSNDEFEDEFSDCLVEAGGDEAAIEQCVAEQEEREAEQEERERVEACQAWSMTFNSSCPQDATSDEIEEAVGEYWDEVRNACDAISDLGGVPTSPECQIADEVPY